MWPEEYYQTDNTTEMLDGVIERGEVWSVTKDGVPIAVMLPIEDYLELRAKLEQLEGGA